MEGDEDSDAGEDLEQLSEIEKIYEVIPMQYRRFVLLAHSLDIILRSPHHFTLLSILLDVSLQHELYHESCVILHWLLRATVSPASDAETPRLCHTVHSNYLIDLGKKWAEAALPMSVFVRVLTTNLVEAVPRACSDLWTCHALTRFTRKLSAQDFPSLLNMASTIIASSLGDGHLQTEEPHEDPLCKRRTCSTTESSLTDQLNKWLNHSSSFPPFQNSILEFLDQCCRSGAHRGPSKSLAATIACWATHYLATTTPNASTHSTLHRLLNDVSPTVTMYNALVERIFGIEQTTTTKLQDSRATLQVYADRLRANNLLLLEASLWACALRFAETSADLGVCALGNEVSLYREELMVLVDDAERRCFQAPQSGWEWEESMGCWIQSDMPPPKKAKNYHEIGHGCVAKSLSASCPLSDIQNEIACEDRRNHASAFELSFTSLISNALSSRTKLHAQPLAGQLRRRSSIRRSIHRTLLSPHTTSYPSDDTTPTSDDTLNLFAYYTEI
ncbi:hypothetical protein B0H12DRAFT_633624 [Mycena haematopus]|nr:hypothetical protein B0H12DRAFT_633624 [Mycena haematopus]